MSMTPKSMAERIADFKADYLGMGSITTESCSKNTKKKFTDLLAGKLMSLVFHSIMIEEWSQKLFKL